MIVIEGPDGGGKTTLVNHLCKHFMLTVGERATSNRDHLYKVTRRDTYFHLSQAVSGKSPARVLDRLFVSEFVYADIVGRPCEFSGFERQFVVDIMNAVGFPMVVCLPSYEVVRDNALKEHQMGGVKQNLETIYLRYKEGILPWPENVLWYDYSGQSPGFATLDDIREEVGGYLEERKARQAWS